MAGQLRKVLFEHTVNVQRLDENTVDERGEKSDTWSNHIVNVPCRIVEQNEVENRSGRNTILTNFIINVPGDVNIEADMRLQDVVDATKYYEIDGVRKSFTRDNRVIGITVTCHRFD